MNISIPESTLTFELIGSAIPLLVSGYCFYRRNEKLSVLFLLISAFLFRLTIAMSDPFLFDWDEKFHALVARHFMDHPLLPTLRTFPALPYNYKAYGENYIWVHKQPLFMWQMALSMKMLGVNFFALRFPSVLLSTLVVLLTYRIAKLWTGSVSIAYISAALLALSNYHLEISSGYYGSDHNEAAFYFYEAAAIWAFCEYYTSADKRNQYLFIFLIGLFAGCAILNKWLVGLLVYGGWALALITDSNRNKQLSRYLHIIYSLTVTAIVFLPWQIYILRKFPLESRWEYEFNRRHITQALEGHGGTPLYYIEHLTMHYGNILAFLVIPGMIFILLKKGYSRPISYAMCSMYVVVYLFFSLIAHTYMHCFVFVVAPIGYIFIGVCLVEVGNLLLRRWPPSDYYQILAFIPLLILGYDSLRPGALINERRLDKPGRALNIARTIMYRQISSQLPDGCVLFTCPEYSDIQLMFWNNICAYQGFPSEKDLQTVLSEGYKVAVFNKCENQQMPDYITNDNRVIKVVVNETLP